MLAVDEYLSIIFLATTHSNAHFNFDDYSSKKRAFFNIHNIDDSKQNISVKHCHWVRNSLQESNHIVFHC